MRSRIASDGPRKRVRFCLWIKDFLTQNPGILDVTFFTDEAWFHLSGYVNSLNTRTWAAENPYTVHEEPLHSQKIGVWCGITRGRIIGPIFVLNKQLPRKSTCKYSTSLSIN